MIELFISDDKQLLESIGREFAYIMGKHLEGPFITKYQGVFPVDQLTPCKYDYSYNKYVDLANMEECKYGIQIRNELLCGM